MTHRTDRVFLPADVARCEPTKPCGKKDHCARYMAAVRSPAVMGDFSGLFNLLGTCSYRISVDGLRAGIKPAKPEAKDYVRGL